MGKKTKKRLDNVIASLRANKYNVSDACEANNISRRTFYNWKNEDKNFAERVEEIKEHVTDTVETALFRNAIDGNVTAQIFWLKNKRSDIWSDMRKVEHSGLISNPIELTDEQKKKEQAILDADVSE